MVGCENRVEGAGPARSGGSEETPRGPSGPRSLPVGRRPGAGREGPGAPGETRPRRGRAELHAERTGACAPISFDAPRWGAKEAAHRRPPDAPPARRRRGGGDKAQVVDHTPMALGAQRPQPLDQRRIAQAPPPGRTRRRRPGRAGAAVSPAEPGRAAPARRRREDGGGDEAQARARTLKTLGAQQPEPLDQSQNAQAPPPGRKRRRRPGRAGAAVSPAEP